jgi:hypothetical protein
VDQDMSKSDIRRKDRRTMLTGTTAAGGMAMINAIGNLGG